MNDFKRPVPVARFRFVSVFLAFLLNVIGAFLFRMIDRGWLKGRTMLSKREKRPRPSEEASDEMALNLNQLRYQAEKLHDGFRVSCHLLHVDLGWRRRSRSEHAILRRWTQYFGLFTYLISVLQQLTAYRQANDVTDAYRFRDLLKKTDDRDKRKGHQSYGDPFVVHPPRFLWRSDTPELARIKSGEIVLLLPPLVARFRPDFFAAFLCSASRWTTTTLPGCRFGCLLRPRFAVSSRWSSHASSPLPSLSLVLPFRTTAIRLPCDGQKQRFAPVDFLSDRLSESPSGSSILPRLKSDLTS